MPVLYKGKLYTGEVTMAANKLTFKAPITIAADDIHKYFFNYFSEKIRLDVSSESSARQRIHMKKSSLIFFER